MATASNVTYDSKAIEEIVASAATRVDGILGLNGNVATNLMDRFTNNSPKTKGVDAKVDDQGIEEIKLGLIVESNRSIPEITDQLKQEINTQVKNTTGMEPKKVTISVDEIMDVDEFNDKYNKKQ